MYKQDLALNNLQGLKCHKTKPNQIYILRGFGIKLLIMVDMPLNPTQPNQTKSYIFNVYVKEDLVLDNRQGLICHKTQPNQIIYI